MNIIIKAFIGVVLISAGYVLCNAALQQLGKKMLTL